jgi:hypothetical protein
MASFSFFDFANEYHLLSNQKVFARVPGKDFYPLERIGSPPGQEIKSLWGTPAVYGEGIAPGLKETCYSVSSMD